MSATKQDVRKVLAEVAGGLDPTEAGHRLAKMGLTPVVPLTREQLLAGDDVSFTEGSVLEVGAAQARGEITAEQANAVLAAYIAASQ